MSEVPEMPEAHDKRLNRAVAITVVLLSTVMALCNVKDGNIVQAMQQAKADAVDTWNEYQATKLKLHLAENALAQDEAMVSMSGAAQPALERHRADQQARSARYEAGAKALYDKARGFEKRYDDLNYRDDQFDMAEGLISIALSIVGVAALIESWPLLCVGWASGGIGVVMGAAGFAAWQLHSDWMARLLG